MSYFLIISIVFSVGVQTVWTEESKTYEGPSGPELSEKFINECAQELNVPVYKPHGIYLALDLLTQIYPGPKSDKMTCMHICLQRKAAEMQGYTFYTYINEKIDEAYEAGFGSPKVTTEELKSKVDSCYVKEGNECEFFKCLDYLKTPFSHLLAAVIKPQLLDVIHAVFH